MLLRKMMSRVGVGSAHVDLILNKSLWRQGETIQGIVHIYGGTVEQTVKRLDVELVQKTIENGKERDAVVAVIPAAGAFAIRPGEKKEIPFAYKIPDTLPLSRLGRSYRFITRLHIEDAVDTLDFDYVQILPKK
ncbi:sporulation protein SpoOM [Geobacillus genomosp. 3]|uniref:Sporulation protein SpoOM n=1 Tax=Geobacillus genomosp. 3 TaxID=1921421 RepID=S5YY97_GEOG3|nr:sporulation protein [Geobacillus genomosp. 3]AGT31669.1 sporulation protein SpoOM [Geobacillus genomosp. 3]